MAWQVLLRRAPRYMEIFHSGGCWRKTMSPRADWLLFSFPPVHEQEKKLGASLTSVAESQAGDWMMQSGWLE